MRKTYSGPRNPGGAPSIRTVLGICVVLAATVAQPCLAEQSGDRTFRLLTFDVGNSGPRLGATRGSGERDIVDVHNAITYLYRSGASDLPAIPIDMRSLIEAGDVPTRAVRDLHDRITGVRTSGSFVEPGGDRRVFHPPTGVRYLPPVTNPSKILGLAGAYLRRAPDGTPGGYDDAPYPSLFFKSPTSLSGHNGEINLWGLLTRGVYEPEFAVVIGKTARAGPEADVMDYIMGYTLANDVSSRDLPMGSHSQQGGSMSKSVDTFTPLGPYITLKEDVPDPHNLEVYGTVNGVRHEWPIPNGNTSFLTFTIEETIAYLSERITLLPGDLVLLGVPQPSMFFAEGETMEVVIGNLGTLRSHVVSTPIPGHVPILPRMGADR